MPTNKKKKRNKEESGKKKIDDAEKQERELMVFLDREYPFLCKDAPFCDLPAEKTYAANTKSHIISLISDVVHA